MKLFIKGKEFIPITKIDKDSYVQGMEEDSAICVVYKKHHVIDPSTELELKAGTSMNVMGMKLTVVNYEYNKPSNQYIGNIVAENVSTNAAYTCNYIHVDCCDTYGDVIGASTLYPRQVGNGLEFFEPGDVSHNMMIQDYREFAYYRIREIGIVEHVQMDETSANIIEVKEGNSKEYNDFRITFNSIDENNLVSIVIENLIPNSIRRFDNFDLKILDKWGRDVVTFDYNNVDVLSEAPYYLACQITPGNFMLLPFEQAQTLIKHEIDTAYDLPATVGASLTLGDFNYVLNNLESSGGVSTININVTNIKDFDIRLPGPLEFFVYDTYGRALHRTAMPGYIGETIDAGETKVINSSIDVDLSAAAYIQFTQWISLNDETMIIPIVPSNNIEIEPGLTVKLTEFERMDANNVNTTLYFENNTGTDIVDEFVADFVDVNGNVLVTGHYICAQLEDGNYSNPSCNLGWEDYYYKTYAIVNIRRKESE